jgi:putative selenate reductase molybdopterin-binding subunit
MIISLKLNGKAVEFEAAPGQSLLSALRAQGLFSVKHGCETGECGACTVLFDGKPMNSCILLAAQASGHSIETLESIGQHPEQGWRTTAGLHPLQQAFLESGAIQCGYCTPAMILAARQLLESNPDPSEEQVRDALSGVICRCTGYLKPVQAVLQAAAVMRGEKAPGQEPDQENLLFQPAEGGDDPGSGMDGESIPYSSSPTFTQTKVLPRRFLTSESKTWAVVGNPEIKVDAIKLVQGKPAFADDFETSRYAGGQSAAQPGHAHALIKNIDARRPVRCPV